MTRLWPPGSSAHIVPAKYLTIGIMSRRTICGIIAPAVALRCTEVSKMLERAGYMALVVIAWAVAVGFAGSVTFLLAELAAEFYEEHFRR